jgi:small subunit ribosomal protein S13
MIKNLRIGNVELPTNKHLFISLTYIFGIGRSTSIKIMNDLNIPINFKLNDLNEEQARILTSHIENNFIIHTALKKQTEYNIKRLIRIESFRGSRHNAGLPIHGRTSSNAKTHKKLRAKGKKFYFSLIS